MAMILNQRAKSPTKLSHPISLEAVPKDIIERYSHHRNNLLNSIAIAYIFSGYGLSLLLVTLHCWWLNLLGVYLLVHTLSWAGFFLHEFFHHNVFSDRKLNIVLGEVMLFLTGSCYSRFRDLALHHIAHHVHRSDFSPFHPFSLADYLRTLPKLVQKLILTLEWFCIPVVAILLRWMIALAPFLGKNRKKERFRNACLLILRGSSFIALAMYSPRAIILYFIAYSAFLNILQFTEGFQHTYSAFHIEGKMPLHSLEYDETHTFSLSLPNSLSWLSVVLFLNNNYHNAHHRLMSCPWYLLPQLDAEIYGEEDKQKHCIRPDMPIRNYFRYRIRRLLVGQGGVERTEEGLDLSQYLGTSGMSFLLLRKPFEWLDSSFWKMPSST